MDCPRGLKLKGVAVGGVKLKGPDRTLVGMVFEAAPRWCERAPKVSVFGCCSARGAINAHSNKEDSSKPSPTFSDHC